MKILVSGFDPFGGEKINPAYEAIKLLPDRILNAEIIKIEIPTSFSRSTSRMEEAIKEHRPDVVLSVGQAGGRPSISVEKLAINLAEARIPDNDGKQPIDEKLRADGENAYFSSLPVKSIIKNIRDKGIPANISYTAGSYVCNSIMYNLLYLADKSYPDMLAGFIHVPYILEQAVDKGEVASMSLQTIGQALEYALEVIIEKKDEEEISMGKEF